MSTARSDESGAFRASFLRPGRYAVLPEDLVRGTTGPVRTVEVKAGQVVEAGEFEF